LKTHRKENSGREALFAEKTRKKRGANFSGGGKIRPDGKNKGDKGFSNAFQRPFHDYPGEGRELSASQGEKAVGFSDRS